MWLPDHDKSMDYKTHRTLVTMKKQLRLHHLIHISVNVGSNFLKIKTGIDITETKIQIIYSSTLAGYAMSK